MQGLSQRAALFSPAVFSNTLISLRSGLNIIDPSCQSGIEYGSFNNGLDAREEKHQSFFIQQHKILENI